MTPRSPPAVQRSFQSKFACPKPHSGHEGETATNIEVLRPLTNIEYIGWAEDCCEGDTAHSKLTAAEFWKRYDALKAVGPK